MKYFIGLLIEGDAAAWHIATAKNISDTFNTGKIHEKFPPHVTVFQTFEVNDIEPIKNLLKVQSETTFIPGNITLTGFDHFGDRVVFANVDADAATRKIVGRFKTEIKSVLGIAEENFSEWHPHATLANHVTPEEIVRIWNFVQTLEQPVFILSFNNLTLFRLEDEQRWVVEQSFRFKTPNNEDENDF